MRGFRRIAVALVVVAGLTSCSKDSRHEPNIVRVFLNGQAFECFVDVQAPNDSQVHVAFNRLDETGYGEMQLIFLRLPRRTGTYRLQADNPDSPGNRQNVPVTFLGTSTGGDAGCGDWQPLLSDTSYNVIRIDKAEKSLLEGSFSTTFLKTQDCAGRSYPDTLRFRDGLFRIQL